MGTRDPERGSALPLIHGDDFDRVVAAGRDGDGQAFAQLYESMNRRILAFLLYRGTTDPEGMVNDVFLKVFTKLETFDGNQTQFTAWVFKIARDTLIDESRARSRRVEETSLQDSHEVTQWSGDVETDAIDQMSTDGVLQHLEVLTPEQRDVIVMRLRLGSHDRSDRRDPREARRCSQGDAATSVALAREEFRRRGSTLDDRFRR